MRQAMIALAAATAFAWARPAQAWDLYSENGFVFHVSCDDWRYPVTTFLGGNWGTGLIGDYLVFDLHVNDVAYEAPGGVRPVDGTVTMPPDVVTTSLRVQRIVTVPPVGGDYVRYLDIVENVGAAPATVTVRYQGDLGFETRELWGDATGDGVVSTADTWYGFHDTRGPEPYIYMALAFWGEGAPVPPTIEDCNFDPMYGWFFYHTTYTVTIEPGARAGFLAFAFQGETADDVTGDLEPILFDFTTATTGISEDDLAVVVNWSTDIDGDGYSRAGGDCDDRDAALNPTAPELCDGIDNDCDDDIDEGHARTSFRPDVDGDGFGDDARLTPACVTPPGLIEVGGDCDDGDEEIHPGAVEFCDELDNDCDGDIDDDVVYADYFRDRDGDGFGATATLDTTCWPLPGWVLVPGDCDDTSAVIWPGAAEVCNGADDDCNGEIDDGLVFETYYEDADRDGYGLDGATMERCQRTPGWALVGGDCDDGVASVHEGAPELCDELDNDCNGEVDDELDFGTWFADEDGDGFGDDETATVTCDPEPGWVETGGDCDDGCARCFPGAPELCDELDNDCDVEVDEGGTIWVDADGDGFGDPATGRESCEVPEGLVENGEDCDDACAACFPGGEEVCDGLDNDCDGVVDDGLVRLYAPDRDGDGYGDAERAAETCDPPSGHVADASDCDDALAEINPGAAEVADGADNDCDGEVDEGTGGDADADADIDADADLEPDADVDDIDRPEDGCGCRAAPARPAFARALVALLLS